MHLGPKNTRRVVAAVAMALAGAAAQAEITTTLSGFGTVGGSFTSDNNLQFHHDASEFTGAGNQFDIGLESRLGLQAKFDFGSGVSVTAQEVLRRRGDKDFDPGTEWLYVQYSPDSDLQIRLGRVVLPVFLYSDSRQVGYSTPWFRSPIEMYGLYPDNTVDGGQVSYNKSLGSVTIGLMTSFGSTKASFADGPITIVSNSKDMLSQALSVTWGDLLLRVADTIQSTPTSLPLSPTFTLNYVGHAQFLSTGAQYDNGKALVVAEWARSTSNQIPGFNLPLSANKNWYAAGGYHFGKFLPMVIYGSDKVLPSLLSPGYTEGSWSGSLRYDLMTGIALKAEVSRAPQSEGQYWVNPSNSNAKANVYSLGADFVF